MEVVGGEENMAVTDEELRAMRRKVKELYDACLQI